MGSGSRTTKQRVVIALSAVAVIGMCVFIFYMSAKPADESDVLSLGVVGRIVGLIVPGYDQMSAADQLYWQQTLNHPVRKTAHFLEYAALGALMMNLLYQVFRTRPAANGAKPLDRLPLGKLAVCAWALSTVYAATDEFHQQFVAGRSCMPTDVLIDSSGVLVGVAVVTLVIWLTRRHRRQRLPRKAGV